MNLYLLIYIPIELIPVLDEYMMYLLPVSVNSLTVT